MHMKRLSSRIVIWSLSVTLALSFLVAALPRSVQAGFSEVACKKNYVVKPGETIYRIAREHEVSVYRLANANNLEKPYRISSGQSLCIPEEPKPSSNFIWTVTYSSDQIKISGTDFKKHHPFFVKVRENDISSWYKLGSALSDRNGDMTVKHNVPINLLKKSILTVCLKDGITDFRYCKTVFKQ